MEFVKGKPFFCDVSNKIKQFPYLDKDISCDVLIIGGGINGAVANFYLSELFDTVLVEAERLGNKCTACATALLEYQLDDFAEDLFKVLSEKEICEIYKAGLFSIEKLNNFFKKFGNHSQFKKKDTLVYSTKQSDIKAFEKEFDFRKQCALDVELLYEKTNCFPFELSVGIFCKNGGAELNPYLFEKQLIKNAKNKKRIFENTKILSFKKIKDKFLVETNFGNLISCSKIVLATGFDFSLVTKKEYCKKFVSYSIVTEPLKKLAWKNNALIQDYFSPYHYMRILPDNRIILGGEDTRFYSGNIKNNTAETKYEKLIKHFGELFPKHRDVKIDYKFCGMFGSTLNNLGFIGETHEKNVFTLLSCGANGIINAMFGVETLIDSINRKKSKFENVFSPKRLEKP